MIIFSTSKIKSIVLNHKLNFLVLCVSLFVGLYLFFFIVPYANKKGFFNENETPTNEEAIKYSLLCIPILIGYILFVAIFVRKTTFLRSFNYPLILVNIYFGFWFSLLAEGGAILWLMIPTLIFLIIALPISLYKGIKKDSEYKS